MYKIKELFDLEHTLAKEYLNKYEYHYEVLKDIKDIIIDISKHLNKEEYIEVKENVWIHKTANIYESAYIAPYTIIGKETEVRHSAFIRGNVLIGNNCVIGNSVELKNCILFDNVDVPHYNYVGDSILGYKAHMGAGSITSNLRCDDGLVVIHDEKEDIHTNIRKVGAAIGDYSQIGCNAVLNPGVILGRNTIIYPTACVRGVIKENSIVTNKGDIQENK